MKKIIIFIASAGLIILSSCAEDIILSDDVSEPQTSGELCYITLESSMEAPGSKVFVSDGNLTPEWSESDVIAVFDNAKRAFTVKECSGSSATFEGSISADYSGTLYAAYPYDAASSRSGATASLVIPSSQKVASGYAVDQDALVAVAASTDGSSFQFKNVTGLVRLQIASDGIASVKLTGNASEALAGTVGVSLESGEINSGGSVSYVVLSPSGASTFAQGVYFIAVAPGTLSGGITLTLTNSDGLVATKSSTAAAVIERSGGINLGDVTTGLSWGEQEQEEEFSGIIESEDVDSTDEDIVSNTTFDYKVKVIFSTTGPATVKNADELGVAISGNDVTITNSTKKNIAYELSGSTTDGFFKLYSAKKQAIILNGASIVNPNGAAINNQSKKRTFVVVNGTNSLADGASYTDTPADEDEKAAFFSEGQLVFSGSGSLSVTAVGKAGISSDDYVRFMSSPTVTVNSSAGHGVRGKDYVLFDGGNTSVKVSAGVVYDSEDAEYKGFSGVKSDGYFGMNKGTLAITNSGSGGKGIRAGDYDYDEENHTVPDSYVTGGSITITTTGKESNDVSCKAIKIGWATKNGTDDHAKVTANAGNFLISGGSIVLTCANAECLEAKGDLTISGGQIWASSSADDALNSQGETNITGGYVYAYSSKNDAIDTNHDLKISGGYVLAITTNGSPEVALDANTEEGYKLYIYSGATVVAYGGLESGYSASQSVYSMSCSAGKWNALYGNGGYLCAFKVPSGISSVAVSAPSVSAGYTNVSVSASTFAEGTWAISGISGGSQVSLGNYT
ncbi:MAG: carbohydrate-binding domain-containing protein, partial [Bacteroidales bacterium]|nr:carbohydrate-binding domain-containing protein [Bacteroidales bacterium]